ncbi:radical SAM protein, partial [bacterium]|nr:radical SAM protein [bacterium]
AINPISDYSEDLDSLPLPAYDLLPLKKYFKITGKRSIPFFTSRGCKNQCAYCTTRQHAGKSVRQFSPQYLLKQIRHLIEYYGVREFFFDDHGLFLDKTYTKSFFKALQESKLKIQWHARNGINPCVLEDDLLDTLKKSGCKRLYFNPDSGSRRILSRCLSKPYNPFVTEQSIQRTLRSGIKVSCQFILGSPGESMDEIYETLNFAWKLRNMGVDQFNFDLAVPYIGTKLRKLAEKKNCLLPYPDQMYTPDDALMSTEQLDAADLIRIRDTAEREFNSRGLVVGLKSRRFNTTKQSAVTEDRIFYSVAPQPYLTSRKLKPALAKNPA